VRALTIAVVLVLALLGASCGGGDDTASDTDTVATETTEDITIEETTDENTVDEGGFATSECTALVTAATSAATAFSGTATKEDVDEAKAQFQEFAKTAPAEIRDDLQVLADAYAKYADELAGVSIEPGETPDAETLQELEAALESIDEAEVTEAAANVNTWTTENC
jgi:hypothetical protein